MAVDTTSFPVRLTLNPVLAGAATNPSVPPVRVAVAVVATAGRLVATRAPPATSATASNRRTGSIGTASGIGPLRDDVLHKSELRFCNRPRGR